jgi:uncharacterized membrane protein YbhN (UPF0104 family)
MTTLLHSSLRVARSPNGRRALNVGSVGLSLAIVLLAARSIANTGFPLANANGMLVAAAGGCFLAAAAVKAVGWSRLFAAAERPRMTTLAAAGGVAAVAGVALPGRVDDALRVAVVRRFESSTVGTIALSLFTLGLVDTVAMTPLASAAAAETQSMLVRAGLIVVASAGLGAAVFFLALPRLAASARFVRFRLSRWLHVQWPTARQAAYSLGFVLAAWLARGFGLYLLLNALGLDVSFALAMVFLCAGAAASALPIGPAGGLAQAGAGASALLASGVSVSAALEVAVAAQLLTVMVSVFVVLTAASAGLVRRRLLT